MRDLSEGLWGEQTVLGQEEEGRVGPLPGQMIRS